MLCYIYLACDFVLFRYDGFWFDFLTQTLLIIVLKRIYLHRRIVIWSWKFTKIINYDKIKYKNKKWIDRDFNRIRGCDLDHKAADATAPPNRADRSTNRGSNKMLRLRRELAALPTVLLMYLQILRKYFLDIT